MEEIAKRMKKLLLHVIAICLSGNVLLAGNWFGPGPFANGAYYPGQYDGVYSASMFGGSPSVVSGVLGFGLRNGSPSTQNESTVSTNGTQNTISVDPFQNYFVVFVEGRTYAGLSIANVNNQSDQVSGGLYSGRAESTTIIKDIQSVDTNTGTIFVSGYETFTEANTCGGAFTANLTGKKEVITFSGNNTGTLEASVNGVPSGVAYTFSLNGMKVGNQTTTTTTTAQ
jgi:hypothetical protein